MRADDLFAEHDAAGDLVVDGVFRGSRSPHRDEGGNNGRRKYVGSDNTAAGRTVVAAGRAIGQRESVATAGLHAPSVDAGVIGTVATAPAI